MVNLNDGNWEILKPAKKKDIENRKLHDLDDLNGPTNKELNDIKDEEEISRILEELDLDDYLWNLN